MRQLWALADKNRRNRKLNEHHVRAAASVAKDLAPALTLDFEHSVGVGHAAKTARGGRNNRWVATWPGINPLDRVFSPLGLKKLDLAGSIGTTSG